MERPRQAFRAPFWLAMPIGAAAMSAAAALFIGTGAWVAAFRMSGLEASGQRDAMMQDGAVLLRVMLAASALMLLAVPVLLHRLDPGERPDGRETGASRGPQRWLLPGLIVLAAVPRALRLPESLWYDEVAAWLVYVQHGPGPIVGNYFDPANQIGHTLLTWCSLSLFESVSGSEVALRLPAFAASLASVAAVHALARSAGGPRLAFIAAALAAILPVSVLEGVEARAYSLMICLSATASWLLLDASRHRSAARWCLYAVVCAFGTWCHLFTIFVPLGHAAWVLARVITTRRLRPAVAPCLAFLLAATLTLTLYAPVLPQLLVMRRGLAATSSDQPTLLGPEGWHMLLQMGGSWYAWAAIGGLVLAALGAAIGLREARTREAIAATWLGFALLLATVMAAGLWTYARFALFALPGAILLMALGLERLWIWRRPAGAAAGAFVLAGAAADLLVRPPKQPLRDAALLIRSDPRGSEPVLAVDLAHRVMDAYSGGLDLSYSMFHGRDIESALAAARPTWIVLYYPRSVRPSTYAAIEHAGFRLVRRFRGWVDWDNGDVLVYRRDAT